MRVILPPMGNLTIEILKGTALVYLVGGSDILFETTLLNRPSQNYALLLFNTLVIYFVIAQVINGLFRLAERRVERRFAGGETTVDAPDTLAVAK